MKTQTLILALPLAVSAATLDTRQVGKAANVAGVVKLEPRFRTNAQRTLTKFGPLTLNGSKGSSGKGGKGGAGAMGGMDSTLSGQSFFLSINKGLCNERGPCTVLGGRVGVMFEDGTPADPSKGIYIHHVLTADTSKEVPGFLSACNNAGKVGRSISSMGKGAGFVGAGEDNGDKPYMYTTMDGKANTGYHVKQGDRFSVNVDLVNYNKEAKKVYLTYDLEYLPGLVGQNSQGTLISITSCGTGIRLNPNGPSNQTSGKFTFLNDGSIVTARGHLHDGGVSVGMSINDKFICASKAGYGGDKSTSQVNGKKYEVISSMSLCDGPIPVKKGDTLKLNVAYDLKQHPLRESAGGQAAKDVMGMLAVVFAAKQNTVR